MINKTLTIVEVCQEFDCDFRVVHEITTDEYMTDGVVVKSPTNELMINHYKFLHLK